ncbi:MAG: flavodoxin [Oscillospiraceae bacterium]|nr:flavodoxin [Oscillospiraceae bacterium]
MKKLMSVFVSLLLMLSFISCSVRNTDYKASQINPQTLVSQVSSAAEQVTTKTAFSSEDIKNFTNFLLGVSQMSSQSEYDLSNDGNFNVLDLCLIKQDLLYNAQKEENNILVAYFSATGATQMMAGYMTTLLDCDTYEIIPAVPYTPEDLDYTDSESRTTKEQRDTSARPGISGEIPDISQYDTIFIGYPIWHGQAPRIISTFLESADFSDKTIIPFCTSASSPIGSSDTNIHSLADSADWVSGRRFSSSSSEDDISQWISELNITKDAAPKNEIKVTVNNTTLTALLEDNSSAAAFMQLLSEGDLTVQMSDYAGFEKVGNIGTSLVENNSQITAGAGDIILYQGDKITIYYDTNSWNFTRLGKIQGISQDELITLLGTGSVTVTFSCAS